MDIDTSKDEDYQCSRQDEMVCPHCFHRPCESFGVWDDEGISECPKCHKEYFYEKRYEITFTTSKIKEKK